MKHIQNWGVYSFQIDGQAFTSSYYTTPQMPQSKWLTLSARCPAHLFDQFFKTNNEIGLFVFISGQYSVTICYFWLLQHSNITVCVITQIALILKLNIKLLTSAPVFPVPRPACCWWYHHRRIPREPSWNWIFWLQSSKCDYSSLHRLPVFIWGLRSLGPSAFYFFPPYPSSSRKIFVESAVLKDQRFSFALNDILNE